MRKITLDKPKELKAESVEPYYPSFHIKLKDIPEAKKWEIGKTYKLEIEVDFKSIREDENRSEVGFDIKAIGVITKNPKEEYKKFIGGK